MPNDSALAPELHPCPQCRSLYCGPIRCRFHGTDHPIAAPGVSPSSRSGPRDAAFTEPCLYYKRACDSGLRGLCIEAA